MTKTIIVSTPLSAVQSGDVVMSSDGEFPISRINRIAHIGGKVQISGTNSFWETGAPNDRVLIRK
jgi:hypothetical protein